MIIVQYQSWLNLIEFLNVSYQNDLSAFLKKNNIITRKQFGFLKNHSTEHAILDLKEFIMESMNKGEYTAVLFLDLQKAFDTVSHSILLQKLNHYGVRGLPLELLTSYLTNRLQYTLLGGVKSDLSEILWGVPQGTRKRLRTTFIYLVYQWPS